MPAKRVIVVTDGDCTALAAVEAATKNINGRCISLTGCHAPGDAYLEPDEVVELIESTPHDPVVLMVDDEGDAAEGRGEALLRALVSNPAVDVIGVVAVASDTRSGAAVPVDFSVTRDGEIVQSAVNKHGRVQGDKQQGDTLGVLRHLDVPIVVGLGDPGKMDYADDAKKGAPITTKALKLILEKQPSLV